MLNEYLTNNRVLKHDQTVRDHRPDDEAFGEGAEVGCHDEEGDKLGGEAEREQSHTVLRGLDLGDLSVKPLRDFQPVEELTNWREEPLD